LVRVRCPKEKRYPGIECCRTHRDVLRLGTSFVITVGTVAINCVRRVVMPSEARSSSKDDKESEDEEDDTVSLYRPHLHARNPV